MEKRKAIISLVLILIIIGGGLGMKSFLESFKPEPKTPEANEILRYVKADTVTYSKVDISISAQGRVNPISTVELIAEASGKIQAGQGKLKVGSKYKKGQTIFSVYFNEAELNLKAQKSKYLTAVASLLPDIKVDYNQSYDAFKQFMDKLDINKPLPELPEISDDGLKVLLASRNVLGQYYSIKQMELQLSRHFKTAPFDGMISQSFIEEGTFAGAGTRVARFISSDRLEIEVPVDNASAEWVKIGDKVKIISSQRNKEWNGKIIRKADFIDAATQSRSIFISAQTNKKDLLSGEFVQISFMSTPIENAFELPRSAVFNHNFVFAVIDGKLKKKSVNILKSNENTVVFNGLEKGTLVVSEALANVKENTKVKILQTMSEINN